MLAFFFFSISRISYRSCVEFLRYYNQNCMASWLATSEWILVEMRMWIGLRFFLHTHVLFIPYVYEWEDRGDRWHKRRRAGAAESKHKDKHESKHRASDTHILSETERNQQEASQAQRQAPRSRVKQAGTGRQVGKHRVTCREEEGGRRRTGCERQQADMVEKVKWREGWAAEQRKGRKKKASEV